MRGTVLTPYQIKQHAKDFGLSYRSAARMRKKYLVQQLNQGIEWMLEENTQPDIMPNDALNELLALVRPLENIGHSRITPDMVEQARGVKIDTLINFQRGKTTAWCHEDKNPSLFHGRTLNIAVCPVCDMKFDAIAIQRHITGQTFIEAVRSLCN